jgi:hypothetical protein
MLLLHKCCLQVNTHANKMVLSGLKSAKKDAAEQRPSILIMKDQERRPKKLISLFSNLFDYLSRESKNCCIWLSLRCMYALVCIVSVCLTLHFVCTTRYDYPMRFCRAISCTLVPFLISSDVREIGFLEFAKQLEGNVVQRFNCSTKIHWERCPKQEMELHGIGTLNRFVHKTKST